MNEAWRESLLLNTLPRLEDKARDVSRADDRKFILKTGRRKETGEKKTFGNKGKNGSLQ